MHEMGIMSSVIGTAQKVAEEENIESINSITLEIGEMTEVVPEALDFAFDALAPGTILEGATMDVIMRSPKSKCNDCGTTYEHDRYQMVCPECGSLSVDMLQGRELHIKSMDVEKAGEE